jgi:hypothetical protein
MAAFELFVDDNFHYMDEDERYSAGTFASYDEALAKAKSIVDEFLESAHEPGMTSSELNDGYVGFGEDPFIVPAGEPRFSAWDYARSRCTELCRDEDALAAVLRYRAWPAELAGFREVLLAALMRQGLGAAEREAVEGCLRTVDGFPDAIPAPKRRYWIRLEHGSDAFTAYLYPDRFELSTQGAAPTPVDVRLRFRGSGLRDRRTGDVAAALAEMTRAAADPAFSLRADA